MTEQKLRDEYFLRTSRIATLDQDGYFAFCKGMEYEREACAKVCQEIVPKVNFKTNTIPIEERGYRSGVIDCLNAILNRK